MGKTTNGPTTVFSTSSEQSLFLGNNVFTLTCLPDGQIELISHSDMQQGGYKVYLGVTL